MINIVVDQGNTSTKVGLFNNKDLIEFHKISSVDLVKLLNQLKADYNKDVYKVIGISTSTDTLKLNELLDRVDIGEIVLFDLNSLPIGIDYKTTSTLGLDRVAGAIGAWSQSNKKNCLIIDAGTAITIDLVIENNYIGGVISPGIHLRFKALNEFTKKLPLVGFNNKEYSIPGKSTKESIFNGCFNGALFEVTAWIDYFKRVYGDILIYLTGGDGIYFEKKLKSVIFVDEYLVLKGLNEVLLHNP